LPKRKRARAKPRPRRRPRARKAPAAGAQGWAGTPSEVKRPKLNDALGSCLAFAYRYLPHLFYLPPAPMHYEWDKIALDPELTRANLQAHRESGKTVFWAIAYPLWRISLWLWLIKQGQPQDDEHGAIFCVDKAAARDRLRQVRLELETNKLLREDFGPIAVGPKWSASEFVVQGARDVKNPTLYADGVGATPGSRLTFAILDDTTHPLHVSAKAQRDKQTRWLDDVVEPMMKEGAPIRAIHTTFHNDDLPARLKKAGWFSAKWPLVIDDAKRIVQWLEAWPWSRVLEKKLKPLVYARQYQLREVLLEERLLPMPDTLWYDPRILQPVGTVWQINGETVRLATGVDPALTEKDTKDGSRTAIVTIAITGTKDKYVVEAKAGRWAPDRVFAEIQATWDKWHSSKVYIEEVAFSKIFVTLFRKETAVPVEGSPAQGDKIQRIVGTLNPPMANRKIHIPDPSMLPPYDPLVEDAAREGMACLIQEITDFPGETKDLLDGLEHAVRNTDTSPVFAVAGDSLISAARRSRSQGSHWIAGRGYGD
jgi:hypothetical protein